jgi:hypothetical protein
MEDRWIIKNITDRDGNAKDSYKIGKLVKFNVFPKVSRSCVIEYCEKPFCGFITSLIVSASYDDKNVRFVTLNSIYTLEKENKY